MYLSMTVTATLVDTLGVTLDISGMSSRAKDERLLSCILQQVHTPGAAHTNLSTIPVSWEVPRQLLSQYGETGSLHYLARNIPGASAHRAEERAMGKIHGVL